MEINSKFELNYITNVVNRDNTQNNDFMNGQLECAKHAQTIIAELIGRLSVYENSKQSRIANELKAVESVEVLSESDRFINISFDIKNKAKVIETINRLPISIYTEDGLTTATIKKY